VNYSFYPPRKERFVAGVENGGAVYFFFLKLSTKKIVKKKFIETLSQSIL